MISSKRVFCLFASLVGFFDALSFCFALDQAKAPPGDESVALPPFIVEDSPFEKLRWRYVELPGQDVLSVCSDTTTEQYLRAAWRLNELFRLLAPEEFQVRTSTPTAVILFDREIAGDIANEMTAEMKKRGAAALNQSRLAQSAVLGSVRTLPNLQLWDTDSAAFCCILREVDWQPPTMGSLLDTQTRRIAYTIDGRRFLLEKRRPSLPAWYVEAVIKLLDTANFEDTGLILVPETWITPEITRELRRLAAETGIAKLSKTMFASNATPLPMEQLLLGSRPPDGASPEQQRIQQNWDSQAALFLRWALDEKWARAEGNSPVREAFWKFIARASSEGVSPALFKNCFGFDYVGMEDKLREYLLRAVTHPLALRIQKPTPFPAISIRYATETEISRIKGEWDRRTILYGKRAHPDLVSLYAGAAERTLMTAYKHRQRDPRLLASIGLYECDIDDRAKGRAFLEEAIKANVARPRVYVEAARLRYEEALQHPAGAEGKLSLAQAESVTHLLLAANDQQPPIIESYSLLVQIWAHCESEPTRDLLLTLDGGARLFRNAKLIFGVSLLEAHNDLSEEARHLVEIGVQCDPDTVTEDRLRQMQIALAKR